MGRAPGLDQTRTATVSRRLASCNNNSELVSHHSAGLGLIGGIVGCFVGYEARTRLVRSLRQPDFNVALLEDLVAIGGSLFIVSRF